MRVAICAAAVSASLAGLALPAASTDAEAAGGVSLRRAAYLVFGSRAPTALCIAHYESTDGRFLYNGSNLGPWQINVAAHTWVDRWRVVHDWIYSARVAFRISSGGTNWRPWSVHARCGV